VDHAGVGDQVRDSSALLPYYSSIPSQQHLGRSIVSCSLSRGFLPHVAAFTLLPYYLLTPFFTKV